MQSEPLKKVQIISQAYYARKDIQQAIYDFCKNRETVPNFNLEFFGKRPDALDYPNDVFNLAKKGATSFHCSEELWGNPLDINTDMTPEQYNEIKIGWDFLIDIDSPFLDYSKIAAKLIIKALELHGIENIGLKFSGSKGFHLIIPWKAFPKQIGAGEDAIQIKDRFPEYPRMIAQYISDIIHDKLTKEILKLSSTDAKKEMFEIIYKPTGEKAIPQKLVKYVCPNFRCKAEVSSLTGTTKKTLRCPSCNGDLEKIEEKEIYIAQSNKDNSEKNPDLFEEKATASAVIEVDIILVSSRHLFRTPYSLHEKTSLASIVIDKNEIENFQPRDADPLKVKIKNFNPDCKEGEARELLMQAIDWAEKNKDKIAKKEFKGKSIDVKNLTITEDIYPGVIKNILKGIKKDGRKRALSILLSFFSSLELPQEYIETAVEKWNKKNYKPIKIGYIKSQISWYLKNLRLPPNYDKPIYRELNLLTPGEGREIKNPLNYTIKQAMRAKGSRSKTKNKK
jgi:DNA-directed RNA polymerase subunit RPC12/RpoP